MRSVEEIDESFTNFWDRVEDGFGNTTGKQSQMIINDHDKNRRHYPVVKSKAEQQFDDGWESEDVALLVDQNNWGGLNIIGDITKALPITSVATITAHEVSNIISERDNKTDYVSYILRKPQEKIRWVVNGHIAIGGHPILNSFESDLDFLKLEGIKAVVSTYEEELAETYTSAFDYYFAPTLKNYTADLIGICEFMEQMEEKKRPVFIHSFDGTGRAPTALAAYMIYRHWLNPKQAIMYIQQSIPLSKISDYQKHELIRFGKRL